MYETARAALQELENDQVFERVALHVLRVRFPQLRITSSTGDLGRDAFGRPLFGENDRVVLWVSLQQRWTDKLKSELVKNAKHSRRAKAIYVMNRSTNEITKERWRQKARTEYGVETEIVTLAELVTELETDGLRWVAELELGVRPRAPRRLSTWAQYIDALSVSVPGMTAPLVGREAEMQALRAALADRNPAARVVVVEGAGGVGKTRLAIEASKSVSAVLVAPTGVSLDAGAFTEAPVDAPLVVLIDDADRAPDLSGLPALLHDGRFGRVRLVLTVRPGRHLGVLQRWNIERWSGAVVPLRSLDRGGIDALVTGRGILNPAFRETVINLAQGNPLIAHAACEAGLSASRFDWPSAADLLRVTVGRRLPADDPAQEHRAAAVALAVLGTVTSGEDLAVLAGAVSTLPPEPHRLSVLLDELADAGLADSSPYSVRPALLAPVLLADALDPHARVRLDVDRVLQAVAGTAGLELNGQPVTSAGRNLEFGASRLGPQLNVLAQAAHDRADHVVGARLAAAVRALLPSEAHLGEWAAVVGLAGEVAVAAPTIFADLHETLVKRWPPDPAPRLLDGGDPVAHYRYGLQHLGERFAQLAHRIGLDAVPSPVSLLLDVAWLMEPALHVENSDRREGVLRAIGQWCSAPAHALPQQIDALFERRREVLRVIARWHRDRAAHPPQELDAGESAIRGPLSLARVLVAALQPLLRLTVESTGGTPESASTISLHAAVLPDRLETLTLLREALTLLAPLLDEPAMRSGEGLPVLHTLVSLPGQLRGEGARPMAFSGVPLASHAVAVLDIAAGEFTEQIAARWDSLPLAVRRSAAQAVLGPDPRPRSLAGAAEAGDAVAAVALADTRLGRLLVLQPLRSRAPWREALEDQQRAAQQLGSEMDLPEALRLLEETGPNVTGVAVSALPAFARAVGAAAPDPQPAFERIAQAPMAGEDALLAGLAQRHPDAVWSWMEERVGDPRLAAAALSFAHEHPAREPRLFDLILQAASAASAAGGEGAARLAGNLTWHLVACNQPLAQRMAVLALLAEQCPAPALPTTLEVIGFLLQEARKSSLRIDTAVAAKYADGLRRRFSESEQIAATVDFDEDTAYGAAEIASSLPEEFAAVASGQLLAVDGRSGLPLAWKRSLEKLPPSARERLVIAFQRRMDEARAAAGVSARVDLTAAGVLTVLGNGTTAWADILRQWASGAPAQRRQAAAAVQHSWQDPLWAEIISVLLSAGVDAATKDALLAGVVLPGMTTDLPDAIQPRREALSPLLTDPTAAVRAFAADALHSLDVLEEEERRREADFDRGYRT
ncbi:hypothetical protein ACFV2H_07235 [Streptomyces sp. NPDC059629]|uniref:hypothetical protein n=1 Tax=Streptomyces sp. NPDC059629 TaxID=3346889 RepID=UPI0036904CBF